MRRFVADASHELRTPLTTIRGFAELYRQGAMSDIALLMTRIEGESARMGLLVEDLLMLARLDAQRPLEVRRVDLLTIAADAVHDAKASALRTHALASQAFDLEAMLGLSRYRSVHGLMGRGHAEAFLAGPLEEYLALARRVAAAD